MRTFSVVNETRVYTRDLRRLIRTALVWCGVAENGLICEFRFSYLKTDDLYGARGWAYTEESRIEVLIPNRFENGALHRRWIAQVLCHEIHHMMGLDHRDMIPVDKIRVPWVAGLGLRVRRK